MCQENTPTPLNHHHQPEPLRQRLSCSLRQILTLSSECNSRNPDSSRFSNLLLSNFCDPVWIIASVCCSYLTGAAPGVVFCCWSPSASGFDVLCVQRCILQTLVIWVTVVFLSSLTSPFSSDLWHQQGIFIHTTAARWIFSLFRTILCKP